MLALTRSRQWVFCNLLCNCLTNPVLNILLHFVFFPMTGDGMARYAVLAAGEVVVVFVEALLYGAMILESRNECLHRSGVTNLVSVAVGLIVFSLI